MHGIECTAGCCRLSSVSRTELDPPPRLPLPVVPRSCGHFIRCRDFSEAVPAGVKHFVQLFWIVNGAMEVEFDGIKHRREAGDFFFHLPDDPHIHRSLSSALEYRWVAFDGEFAAGFMRAYDFPATGLKAGACPVGLFMDFENRMRELTPFCWREMVADIASILALAGGSDEEESAAGKLVVRAAKLCRQRFTDAGFDVNALAGELGVNRSTLLRVFKDRMRIQPSKYLIRLRIQRALSLLHGSRRPLDDIAAESGFTDAAYLCRVIRRNVGIPPSLCR